MSLFGLCAISNDFIDLLWPMLSNSLLVALSLTTLGERKCAFETSRLMAIFNTGSIRKLLADGVKSFNCYLYLL